MKSLDGALKHNQMRRSASTKDKILDATYDILRDVGHAGLRSANVCDVSGVSRGGLLHHYPTKEILVAAVYARIVTRLEEASRQKIEEADEAAGGVSANQAEVSMMEENEEIRRSFERARTNPDCGLQGWKNLRCDSRTATPH